MGTPIEVKATAKNGAEGVVNYDFGDTVEEAIEKFGGKEVHGYFVSHGKVVLQAAMRRYLEVGKDVSDLSESWKPGVTLERITDPVAVAKALYAKYSPEEREAFLQQLREMEG